MRMRFRAAVKGIKKYDAEKGIPFPAYIKTKLNFDIYNLCRKNRSILSCQAVVNDEDQNPLEWLEDESIDIQQDFLRKEEISALHKALNKLQPKYREVIVLHYFKNITLKDIAKEMDISGNFITCPCLLLVTIYPLFKSSSQ